MSCNDIERNFTYGTRTRNDTTFIVTPDGRKFINPVEESLSPAVVNDHLIFRYQQGREVYYLNDQLQPILPEGFYKHRPLQKLNNGNVLFEVTNGEEFGVLDINGKWIVGPDVSRGIIIYQEGFVITRSNGRVDLYDDLGNKIDKNSFSKISISDENTIVVTDRDDNQKLFSYLADAQLKKISENYATIRQSGKYLITESMDPDKVESCIFNSHGKKLRCLPFAKLYSNKEPNTRFIVETDSGDGLVDSLGNEILPSNYYNIQFKHGFYILEKERGEKEILNQKNEITLKGIKGYQGIRPDTGNKFFICTYDQQYHVLDENGQLLYSRLKRLDKVPQNNPLHKTMFKGSDERHNDYYVNKKTGVVYWKGE